MAEDAILGYLENNHEIPDSGVFAHQFGIDHADIVNVTKSLNGFRLVLAQDIKKENWVLTKEGKRYAADGSPEMQVYSVIPEEGISIPELKEKVGEKVYEIGFKQAMRNKWVEIGKQLVSRKAKEVNDKVKELLSRIQAGEMVEHKEIDDLKRRKLITLQTWKGYSIKKGPNYAPKRIKAATDLTREHLQSGAWKNLELKEYNFNAKGPPSEGGHLHPLLKVKKQFKDIFLQMGFEEMRTNSFVQSSFWNFDALFQPQQHPARDSHDTFFLKVPSSTQWLPEDYVERVKRVHEIGGYGSRGYGYDWKREEANKTLLRTHTTADSSRILYKLAQELAKKPCAPKKYFSIDRVFRNESVDRTHLAEFHQIEGLVCDRGLTLGDLTGVLDEFFLRLGMKEPPRYKPAYKRLSKMAGFKKWVEIGNSGMFRPEMLLPMGLPEDVHVIAWGLSLERPTVILYGIDNIRDLFGHKVDLGPIKKNPICRVGLEWLSMLSPIYKY